MSIGKINDFNIHTDNWKIYAERIELYFQANKVDSQVQVSTFLTLIGAECYELLVSLCTPDSPKSKSLSQLIAILTDHLQPKPSILAERYKFRNRKQNVGEVVKDYAAVLKKMSASCDFGATLQENLRDQFACGIASETIRQRLFSEEKLSFQRAFQLAVGLEAAEKDAAAVIGGRAAVVETNSAEVQYQAVRPGRSGGGAAPWARARPAAAASTPRSARPVRAGGGGGGGAAAAAQQERRRLACRACGGAHNISACQFTRYVCRVCNKVGHLRRVCPNLSQQYNVEVEVAADAPMYGSGTEDSDEVTLNMNHLSAGFCPPIRIIVNINGVNVTMECDTGSAVSCISYELCKKLFAS